METWEPKPPGNLWATSGLLRDCFTIFLPIYTHAVTSFNPLRASRIKHHSIIWCLCFRMVVIAFRTFGTAHLSHLQGRPGASARNCHYMLRNSPEEHSSNLLHGRTLRFRKFLKIFLLFPLRSLRKSVELVYRVAVVRKVLN